MIRFFALVLVLFFVGCSHKNPILEEEKKLSPLGKEAPKWIKNPPNGALISAVGSSVEVIGGIRFQQLEAENSAKLKLSREVERRLEAILPDILRFVRADLGEEKIAQDSSKLASLIVLSSSKNMERKELWWSFARDHYVLFTIKKEEVKIFAYRFVVGYLESSVDYREFFDKEVEEFAKAKIAEF